MSLRVKKLVVVVLIVLLALMLFGCLPGNERYEEKPANFFTGIWHGWLAPISLIRSIAHIAPIYEVNNTGWGYDLGFYMAIISGFGALSLTRRKRK